jgi:hypothetical protein
MKRLAEIRLIVSNTLAYQAQCKLCRKIVLNLTPVESVIILVCVCQLQVFSALAYFASLFLTRKKVLKGFYLQCLKPFICSETKRQNKLDCLYYTWLKRLVRDKHTSLFCLFGSIKEKRF